MGTVVLVAHDVNPSSVFDMLAKRLDELRVQCAAYMAYGKAFPDSVNESIVREAIENAGVVLAGMSSSPKLAEMEMTAIEHAKKCGVPYALFSDTYGCYKREWFQEHLQQASAVFVISPEEQRKCIADVLQLKGRVVASGNPLWERFCFPKYTRVEVREKFGIQEDERVILSPANKVHSTAVLLWGGIINALWCRSIPTETKFRLIFAPHPGDASYQKNKDVYADLIELSPVPTMIIDKEMMPTSNFLPAADMVVESCSTTGIEAAHLRIPLIDYMTGAWLEKWRQLTGSKEWELCELGASQAVYNDPTKLAHWIELLIDQNSTEYKLISERQKKIYPKPPKVGVAVDSIINGLTSITRH